MKKIVGEGKAKTEPSGTYEFICRGMWIVGSTTEVKRKHTQKVRCVILICYRLAMNPRIHRHHAIMPFRADR